MRIPKRNISVIFILLFCIPTFGQVTKIRGNIVDASTKEALPFVNIAFQNTTIGTISDFNGNYFLQTRKEAKVLVASYVGYKTQHIEIKPFQFQSLNIELEPDNINLQEVVVKPGENPAHILLRKIIENKDNNNPKKAENFSYEAYNKVEIDINNIDEKFKSRRVFNQFQFIFDYIDTSVVTAKNYLPVLISETISDFYYQNDPKRSKENIKAHRMSGIENESISQYTGQMYQDVNVYDNFIQVFGKGFVSPIANVGLLYYRYYLIDSTFIDNMWCYQISFKPRRKQEPTFTGDFWVTDTLFAIKKINVRIAEDANLNFVNDLIANYEYQYIDNKYWFLERDELFIDFNITDSTAGFFGRKTTTYKDIKVDIDYPDGFFVNNSSLETILQQEALVQSDEYWHDARHIKLTKKEESIYNMVDSIKDVPMFRTFVDIITLFVSGYYIHNNFEFGPYYTLYSFNPIEGNRIRIGGRTSNDFSTKVMYTGHLAYGTKDERLKYALGMVYMVSKNPRIRFGLDYKHDMEQLGQSQNAFLQDNILASLLSREYNRKLTMVNEFKGHFENEWFQGFSNTLTLSHREVFATDFVIFEEPNDGPKYTSLSSFEIKLSTRFAFNEKFLMGEFERVSLGTRHPIMNLNLVASPKGFLGSNYEYYKVNFNVKHTFHINPFGKFRYIIDMGQYFGNTPYPFLQLHEGNETYAYDDYAFNMMNYYEFVSDRYISLFTEHHFEGFFLNRIPLMRKLKWREVVTAKGLYGRIDDSNKDILIFPENLTGLKDPYFEAGVGVENIFKIIRIDALWRLSYLDKKDIPKFGLRAKLQIDF